MSLGRTSASAPGGPNGTRTDEISGHDRSAAAINCSDVPLTPGMADPVEAAHRTKRPMACHDARPRRGWPDGMLPPASPGCERCETSAAGGEGKHGGAAMKPNQVSEDQPPPLDGPPGARNVLVPELICLWMTHPTPGRPPITHQRRAKDVGSSGFSCLVPQVSMLTDAAAHAMKGRRACRGDQPS
jgi:hypothetical protein